MASAEALAELQRLLCSAISRVSAPLEKMPAEASNDPQEKTRCADEPAALPDSHQSIFPETNNANWRGARRPAVECRRGK